MSLNTILATAPLTTQNYVLKATGTTIGNSLIWDNGTNVGIGNTNTSYTLDVTGTGRFTSTLITASSLLVNATSQNGTDSKIYVKQSSDSSFRGVNIVSSTSAEYVGGLFMDGSGNFNIAQSYLGSGSYQALTFLTSGTERMRITSGGQVGIGGTPSSWDTTNVKVLQLKGTALWTFGDGVASFMSTNTYYDGSVRRYIYADYAAEYDQNAGNHIWYSNPIGTAGVSFTPTERMRITSGGNQFVYVNTAASWVTEMYNDTSSTPYGIYLKYRNAAPNSTGSSFLRFDDSSVNRLQVYSNGGLANYSGNNVNLASDRRLKKDIVVLSTEWNKLKQIEIVNYRYKDSDDETALYGAIAQQVQEVYPDLVVVTREATETEPEYYGLREQPFQWLTTKVLQEAMAKIESLEATITSLQDRLSKGGL
jgi:hypothetical protein